MVAFLEATLFLCWILTVVGVLRWFHNVSNFDDYIDSADRRGDPQMLAFRTTAREDQRNSRAPRDMGPRFTAYGGPL